MRIKRFIYTALAGLMALGSYETVAQSNNRSPYSRYGYGSIEGGNTAGSRAMGGLSVGLRDALITNPQNPASYTSVDSLTFIFDLGLSARYGILQEGSTRDNRLLGNLEYLTMIYPLGKRMAMSAGVMPLTSIGYNFGLRANMAGDANDNTSLRSYSGNGSYNNLYVGLAANPFLGLHLGLNVSYIFGHTTKDRQVVYSTTGALNSVYSENLHLRGIKLDLGAQYELKLDTAGSRSFVFGASFTPKYSYGSERTITQQLVTNSGSSEVIRREVSEDGSYTSPNLFGVGASYRVVNRYMVGVDVRYGEWSKAEFTDLEAKFKNQWKFAIGGEWTPDHRARSPWKRAKYRAGLSASNSYLSVPTSGGLAGYREYGLSLGLALPLVDRRSALNVSLDYKYLQPRMGGMVTEHYIGATVGILFNEGWFRKARVN